MDKVELQINQVRYKST